MTPRLEHCHLNSREDIVNKAKKMVEISWTPKKDLVGWRGNFIFAKGKTYKGIPYSQTEYQKNDTGFLESLNKNDFYDYYTRFGMKMPNMKESSACIFSASIFVQYFDENKKGYNMKGTLKKNLKAASRERGSFLFAKRHEKI